MTLWEAAFLGVVQGVTEFLPISSTAHLVIARQLLGHETPEDAFTVIIQVGTLAAVFGYFRTDVAVMIAGLWNDLKTRKLCSTPGSKMAWLVVLGSFPAGISGLTLRSWLKTNFYTMPAIAWVAIVFALLMALAEWWSRRRIRHGHAARNEESIHWLDALWIGLFQAMALMPGGSRSGTTITAGLFAGLARPAAARFSFLLSLPIMLAAGAKEFWESRKEILSSGDQMAALAVGLVVSALVGYVAVSWLIAFLRRYSTNVFIVYRLLLGATILAALATGLLQPLPGPSRSADEATAVQSGTVHAPGDADVQNGP